MYTCYVSGKYSPKEKGEKGIEEIDRNIEEATSYAIELFMLGFAVFTPHLNSAHFEDIMSYEDIMRADMKFVELMDTMFMIPNWKDSLGAKQEKHYACLLGKAIFYNIEEAGTWLARGVAI